MPITYSRMSNLASNFFYWSTNLRIFYQLDRPFGSRLNQFDGFQLKFIIGVGSNSNHLSLFLSYLPPPKSESHFVFFVGFLILQGIFYQIFKKFLSRLNQLAFGSIGSSSQLMEHCFW